MKLFKYAKLSGAFVSAMALLAACDKVDEPNPLGDDGVTIVKLVAGGTDATNIFNSGEGHILNGIDFVNTAQIVDLADVRRDVPNNAELNRTMTVTVKDDTTALRVYNDSLVAAGDDPLLVMPTSWYTWTIPPTGGSGGTYNVVFQPGEFAKQISINLPNATLLDPSSTYGFAFTITSADADGVISTSKTLVYELGAKNIYDGVYTGKGYGNLGGNTMAPHLFSWNCDFGIELTTTGANSVDMNAQPLYRSPGTTTAGFSNVIPQFTFDPVTNKVTSVTPASFVASSISFQFPVDGGTYDSRYDPATKTIYVHFGLNNNPIWRITDTLTWCKSR